MKFKTFIELLFHAVVTMMIIILPVSISCVLLYNRIPNWSVAVSGVVAGLISIFPALKYIIFVVNKDDLFKDMF